MAEAAVKGKSPMQLYNQYTRLYQAAKASGNNNRQRILNQAYTRYMLNIDARTRKGRTLEDVYNSGQSPFNTKAFKDFWSPKNVVSRRTYMK